jgi:hypothetical protein
MFGFVKAALIRFARKIVESVLSQLMQQFNIVQEQAFSPMQAMVQQVTDGMWVGRGADAFVEEVSSIMMPGVGKIGDGINIFSKNINNAIDVMDRADEQVNNFVNSLGDLFGGIFLTSQGRYNDQLEVCRWTLNKAYIWTPTPCVAWRRILGRLVMFCRP